VLGAPAKLPEASYDAQINRLIIGQFSGKYTTFMFLRNDVYGR
jgi:hypothetical protein